jgi:import receptor subunit TOM20
VSAYVRPHPLAPRATLTGAQLAHSCAPSVRPAFRDGSARLSLVAQRDLKAGDELTMAYVDVAQRPEEALDDARRRRRWALARGWRFACTCEKCLADGAPTVTAGAAAEAGADGSEESEPQMQDESRVTEVVRRAEGLV